MGATFAEKLAEVGPEKFDFGLVVQFAAERFQKHRDEIEVEFREFQKSDEFKENHEMSERRAALLCMQKAVVGQGSVFIFQIQKPISEERAR